MVFDIWTNVDNRFPMILRRLYVTGSEKITFSRGKLSASLTFCHKCITQCTITNLLTQNIHFFHIFSALEAGVNSGTATLLARVTTGEGFALSPMLTE
jgi:hypothetical protein